MFSGLIAHAGRVAELVKLANGGMTLHIAADSIAASDVQLGDSIAVDGVCLTVTAHNAQVLSFDVVPETISRTTIAAYETERMVNLELSLRFGDRLGGHLVYAHVDTTARVLAVEAEGQGARYTIERPPTLRRYIVEKGYVAIDGVSLTVASVSDDAFTLALIPETLARTTLGERKAQASVNLEIDPIARYACDLAAQYAVPQR